MNRLSQVKYRPRASSIKYTTSMANALDKFRTNSMLTWEDFFKRAGIKGGRSTLLYWEKTGRISFTSLVKIKALGLDLSLYSK